jgi:hypothetical protein
MHGFRIARWQAWLSLCLVLALLGVLDRAASAPGADTIPLADYWQRLAEVRDDVRAARELSGADRRARLDQAAAALESVDAVLLPDGTRVVPDNRALIAALRDPNPNLTRLESSLDALGALGRVELNPPPYADAARQLAAIMAQPEFQYPPPSPLQQALERLLFDLAAAALRALFWLIELIARFPLPVLIVVALVLLALLVYVLRRTQGALVPGAAGAGDLPDEQLSSVQALQRAQSLASGGDYRQAVRYLYLSTILFLEEAGRLRRDRSLTNREYLRQVADQPDVAALLLAVVTTFDRVWYGFAPLDAAAYEDFVQQVQALHRVKIV